MMSKRGWAAANAASDPPAMKVNVPPAAPPIPPETGASTLKSPAASASCATARALSTSTVEQSISVAPGRIAGMTSAATLRRIAPLGSIVITTSCPVAAAATVAAWATPSAVVPATSNPVTECPARARFAAIGAPMFPSPMNPIFMPVPSNFKAILPSGISILLTAMTGTFWSANCHFGVRSLSMIAALIPSRKSPCSIARAVKRYSRSSAFSKLIEGPRRRCSVSIAQAMDSGLLRPMRFSVSRAKSLSSALSVVRMSPKPAPWKCLSISGCAASTGPGGGV
mmetsp:Transcript_18094/g.27957  ORF Transcript_18094/g.27957 Transcript_18094/m.27957 type:complete len:283 (+) Transcript_18094:5356-6204(+)